ncbi:MAG: hypothetical protein M1820_004948 [Bogoriella megaspora]|nr:MAG: hypothetical protein M1820_004948 [Bogoriella megaspora]
MLAPVDDSSIMDEEPEIGWHRTPTEADAIMVEPGEKFESTAWRHFSDTGGKSDAYQKDREAAPHPEPSSRGRKSTIAKWQKKLSHKLSEWYPSSWDEDSADDSTNDTSNHSSHYTKNKPLIGVYPDFNESSELPSNITLGDSLDTPSTSPLFKSAPRIAKCTISFNYNPIYERALRTHDAHNQLHNYPLYINRQSILDDVWTKPAWILALLLRELARPAVERLEWLFWMDADTVLLNPYIPISAFLPPETGQFDDVHMIVVHDWNGLNNGIFAIRVCQWSVQLHSSILAFQYYRPDVQLTFRDQSAMAELLMEPKFARHTVKAPQRWFNAYQGEHNETLAPFQVRRGDFLVHFAGVGDREQRMKYWLERAEQHLPDWEIEYRQTSYPSEVRDFWGEIAAEKETKRKRLEDVKARIRDMRESVHGRLDEFQDRLTDDVKDRIISGESKIDKALGNEETADDPNILEEKFQDFVQASQPLNELTEKANKVLMKEAQDAIFKAQDTTLKYTGTSDVEDQLADTDEKLSKLKDLVLQSSWRKSDVKDSIDNLRHAHAHLKEKLDEIESKKKQEALDKAEKEAKEKAEAERKEQLEKEAEEMKKQQEAAQSETVEQVETQAQENESSQETSQGEKSEEIDNESRKKAAEELQREWEQEMRAETENDIDW